MYFIPRNNKIYHYLAHTNPYYRYPATASIVFLIIIIWFYCIYNPLQKYIELYTHQQAQLHDTYNQINFAKQEMKKFSSSMNDAKAFLLDYPQDQNDEYKDQFTFIVQQAQHAGLKISAYTVVAVQGKEWYTKEKVHFDFVGTVDQCMQFLEGIKNSRKMILCNNVTLSSAGDAHFQMGLDLAIIAIVK